MIRRFVLILTGAVLSILLASGVYYSLLISDTTPTVAELVFRTRFEKFLYHKLGFTSMGGAWKYVREVQLDNNSDRVTNRYVVFGKFKNIDLENSILTITDNDGTEYLFHVDLIKKNIGISETYLSVVYIGTDKIPTIQDLLVSSDGKTLEGRVLNESELISVYWNDDSIKREVVSDILSGNIIGNLIEISVYDYSIL